MTQAQEVVFPQRLLTRSPSRTCQQNFSLLAAIQMLPTAFQISSILSLHVPEPVAPSGGYSEVLSELEVHRMLKLQRWTGRE